MMRCGPAPRLSAIVLATITVLASTACGDPATSTPSPEVIATAESVARTVNFTAPPSTTPEKGDDEKEDVVLDARVFGSGPTGVILAHMRPSDQTSWFPFATELARTGDYTVMTFDFRGYGESTGDKQFDRIDTDLEAAFGYMRESLSIDKIFVIGASMGGTAALVVGERLPVAGIVSISSPSQFPPLDAEMTVGGITAPKLFVTSEDDVPASRSQERFWELAQEPKEQEIYEGDAHGTDIFNSPNGDALEQRLMRFLQEH
jgi:pimeloyl-ACP methyl ester carboxylesterase